MILLIAFLTAVFSLVLLIWYLSSTDDLELVWLEPEVDVLEIEVDGKLSGIMLVERD
jgi:hypothetical protein